MCCLNFVKYRCETAKNFPLRGKGEIGLLPLDKAFRLGSKKRSIYPGRGRPGNLIQIARPRHQPGGVKDRNG